MLQTGYSIVRSANLDGAAKWLGCKLSHSSEELQRALATATHTKPTLLGRRQHTIRYLREEMHTPSFQEWDSIFEEAAAIEKECETFRPSPFQADTIGQLSFQHEALKSLNVVPWMIFVISLFKVWVVPTMAVLTPILAWILPYFLLKFVYSLPIDHEEYTRILQSMWSGVNPIVGTVVKEAELNMWSPKSLFQMFLFAISFLSSLVQPIQTAIHLYNTDKTIYDHGRRLLRLKQIIQRLRADLGEMNGPHVKLSFVLETLTDSDPRAAFMLLYQQPERLDIIFHDLAKLEILWRIAQEPALTSSRFTVGTSGIVLENARDLSLEKNVAVPSSITLLSDKENHAVVTGPNGGGKSSFLRAILQCVLFSQSFGFAPADKAYLPRFKWIASGLQLRDQPGSVSMFETEVKFAADVLATARTGRLGLVLFDELFHSTNPPDAERTASRFLSELWSHTTLFSIVSTHVFSLVAKAPKTVQAVCCPAEKVGEEIHYKYKVEPGICKVSSVEKVWEKFGFRPASGPPAAKSTS